MSTASSPATGPRALAEQSILRIIWPPDGRPTWEDRHKIPPIERALNHLLDVVEGAEAPQTSITVAESQALTEKAVVLRRRGMKLRQIADILGLSEKAVSSRLSDAKKKQTISRVQTEQIVTSDGKPAALRSAAPDHIVEANEMVTAIDSAKAKPPANDGTLRNVAQVEQAQPKTEQVPGQAGLQDASPAQSEKATIRKDRMVEESKEVRIEREDGKERAKIPHAFDAQIIDQKKSGKTYLEIAEALRLHGLSCTGKDVGNRIFQLRKQGELTEVGKERLSAGQRPVEATQTVAQKDDIPAQPAKDVMLPAQACTQTEDKPAAKAIGRAELDAKIWELHKAGQTPGQISDALYAEGLYYSEKSVVIRLRSQLGNL